jgi:hypothetical protein
MTVLGERSGILVLIASKDRPRPGRIAQLEGEVRRSCRNAHGKTSRNGHVSPHSSTPAILYPSADRPFFGSTSTPNLALLPDLSSFGSSLY